MSLESKLTEYQSRVEIALDKWLPIAEIDPGNLHEAMRYAVLGSGKRIRPVLVYATGETFGVELAALDAPAVAVELIHAYSLIHDDLPAMDDDDLRRGKPTCHKAFDEATAILAGDAIQALSFDVLANDKNITVGSEQKIQMISCLAVNSGSLGMAGGQAIDLASVGKKLTLEQLENMHSRKTGALIRASVELGALSVSNLSSKNFDAILSYAKSIGLAFQIRDDILDIESETSVLGKPQGSDAERNKPTYPELLGLSGAKRAAEDLHQQ
ncbi:MAG: geranylgeranyl pyrophosphate synthase, partial [Gammaproteobacteria bacterium]